MARPRISAISFLNTAPLMWDFEHTPVGQRFEISYTIPSLCAAALRDGVADIGLIPAVTSLTIPDLVVIPDVAIAARGPVRSILLVSKVPVEQIRSVAADTSSRTSVALCRLLLKRWLRVPGTPEPQFHSMEPQLSNMLKSCDAALLIGDSALRVSPVDYFVLDLAAEWHRFTGQPFVFAFWAVRKEIASPELPEIFQRSKENGLRPENLDRIASAWAPRIGITEQQVKSYLTANICFDLTTENLFGLQLFFDLAAEEGILPKPLPLRFIEVAPVRTAQSAD
jgi:chorismate dehydratase